MAETSEIAWTHSTFNPWIGCTKVAPGCTHCYAEAYAQRYNKAQWGPRGTRVKTSEAYWRQPLKWNREAEAVGERRRVFCASLADVFEEWDGAIVNSRGEALRFNATHGIGPWHGMGEYAKPATMAEVRRDLFALIDATPQLDWLLLTKRPENIRRMWPAKDEAEYNIRFRENVWLLTSVSEQESADRNIPELLKCRDLAPVLGISAEPLLGLLDLNTDVTVCDYCGRYTLDNVSWECVCGQPLIQDAYTFVERLDWVIVGGESGGSRRACEVGDIVSIVQQCQSAGVPCFVKQDSALHAGQQGRIPDDVWAVKEFPTGAQHG